MSIVAVATVKAWIFLSTPIQATATLVRGDDCPSPTGALVATEVILMGGGAAGWVDRNVSIRPAGDSIDLLHMLRLNSRYYDIRLDWLSDHELNVVLPHTELPRDPPPIWILASGDTIQVTYDPRPGMTERYKTGYFADSVPGCPMRGVPPDEFIRILFPCGYGTRCPGAKPDWVIR